MAQWNIKMSIVVSNKSRNFIANKIGKHINSPEQRLIQGVTALFMQPAIDYFNHSADDETRAVSVSRTIGKIVAGMCVGVAVRYGAIYCAKNFANYTVTKIENNFVKSVSRKSSKDILMPTITYSMPSKTTKEFAAMHDNHIKTMGTILATFAMLFTNFLIDAPLTKLITKLLTPVFRTKISKAKLPEVKKDND